MNTNQSGLAIDVDLREFPRVLHYSPVQLLRWRNSEEDTRNEIGMAVSYDISRGGMRIFTSSLIEETELAVRFLSPTGADIIQNAYIVRHVQSNEWISQYGLQFETPLPESAM